MSACALVCSCVTVCVRAWLCVFVFRWYVRVYNYAESGYFNVVKIFVPADFCVGTVMAVCVQYVRSYA